MKLKFQHINIDELAPDVIPISSYNWLTVQPLDIWMPYDWEYLT